MKQILITIGLSRELKLSRFFVKNIGIFARAIAPQINNRSVCIISSTCGEVIIAAEAIRQILRTADKMAANNEVISPNIPYRDDASNILDDISWKAFLKQKLSAYELVIFISKDRMSYGLNEMAVFQRKIEEGAVIECEQIYLVCRANL